MEDTWGSATEDGQTCNRCCVYIIENLVDLQCGELRWEHYRPKKKNKNTEHKRTRCQKKSSNFHMPTNRRKPHNLLPRDRTDNTNTHTKVAKSKHTSGRTRQTEGERQGHHAHKGERKRQGRCLYSWRTKIQIQNIWNEESTGRERVGEWCPRAANSSAQPLRDPEWK